jgi:hypothetical protein
MGISNPPRRDADLVLAGIDERAIDPALQLALEIRAVAGLGQRPAEHALQRQPPIRVGRVRFQRYGQLPHVVDAVNRHDHGEQVGLVRFAAEGPALAARAAAERVQVTLDSSPDPGAHFVGLAQRGGDDGRLDPHPDPLRTRDPQAGRLREARLQVVLHLAQQAEAGSGPIGVRIARNDDHARPAGVHGEVIGGGRGLRVEPQAERVEGGHHCSRPGDRR